jgi:SSS family solute:Na+ symporter
LKEAQKGMVFAAYLKFILPFVVVIPGIVVFAMHADITKADEAYPWLLKNIVPTGLKGLIFAALIAAIVSSFSAIINSASTIFTMDLYKPYFHRDASERQMVRVGRLSSVAVVIMSVIVAASLGNLEQAFQFIQKYTGMVSPGITAIFVLGMFWKRATSEAAFWGTILSIPLSAGISFLFPQVPFLDQMLISFFVVAAIMVILSLSGPGERSGGIELSEEMFKTDKSFNILAIIILVIFAGIYTLFW